MIITGTELEFLERLQRVMRHSKIISTLLEERIKLLETKPTKECKK